MDADLLLAHFPQLISRAEDVPRLNELILQLAVQGKLVPQDADDEPASELHKRIAAEKKRLVKEGKIKKSKPLPEIEEDERPYEIPHNWQWVRLPEIYYSIGQKKPDVPFTYIDVSSIDNVNGRIGGSLSIISPKDAPSRARKLVNIGTVIYSTVRPYLLNIAIIDHEIKPEPIVSTAFAVMHPFEGVYNRFLFYYLRCKSFINFVESQMTGMAYPAISDSKLNKGHFPLPPHPEQKRIVARVDTLLAQTRQLEAALSTAEKSLTTLHSTAVQELLAAANPDEFAAQWAFIAANFETLYDPAYPAAALANIAELKQTILQLAVQGKLTRQEPSDEPAALLLQRIAAEKERLVKEGKIKKSKPLPEIGVEERPYDLPDGWGWARISDVTLVVTDGRRATPPRIDYEEIPLVTAKNVRDGYLDLTNTDFVTKETAEKSWQRCQPLHNDLLMVCVGATTGRASLAINPPQMVLVRSVALLRPYIQTIIPEYLEIMVNSPLGQDQVWEKVKRTAQPVLYLNKINQINLPLPPLPEQKRIITRVTTLHHLCDNLAAQIEQSQSTGTALRDLVLS